MEGREESMEMKPGEVTQLLVELREGDREVLDELFPVVYDELRRLARIQLQREHGARTLQTTALVHEAYFKLVDHHDVDWKDRSHFFAVAARAMRQVLVDRARRRNAKKRGGEASKITLQEEFLGSFDQDEAILALDEALKQLEQWDERQSRVVEYRFFAGLTVEEAAAVLDVSASTVKRDWRTAKAWLYREMQTMLE